ncbi:MAG: ATP-binding protein [Candidatus Aenigmatarchaeota archaeon]
METEEIKRVIVSQKEEMEEKFERGEIIEREVEVKKLRNFLVRPNILVILGVRRCGKSIFSWQIFRDGKFGSINFDDERLVGIEAKDLDKILQAFYELYGRVDRIILDEPQNVENWELFVNRLRRSKKVIVTGSNSKLLAGDLATHLTGRYVDFTLMPFSFREFLKYKKVEMKKEDFYSTVKVAEIKRLLENYVRLGGLPEVFTFGKEILVRIYGDIIEKDVLRRFKIKRKDTFKQFAKYLVSNIASEFTMRRLSSTFEVRDSHTLKNWIDALENSYLFFILERYSPKLKEQIIAPKKIYCVDTGIVNAVSFRTSENFGKLMENLVGVELVRRKNYWYKNLEIFYWKDYQQNEVDFVLKEGLKVKQLIQVTYASSKDEVEKREIKSLVKASDLLKCKDLLVITWDYEGQQKIKNKKIVFKPLWKWLLIDFFYC